MCVHVAAGLLRVSPVVHLLLPAALRVELIDPVVLRQLIEHLPTEDVLLGLLLVPGDGLELALVLVGQRNLETLPDCPFPALPLGGHLLLLRLARQQVVAQRLHVLALGRLARHVLGDGLERRVLCILRNFLGQPRLRLALHHRQRVLADLVVLPLQLGHASGLELLLGLQRGLGRGGKVEPKRGRGERGGWGGSTSRNQERPRWVMWEMARARGRGLAGRPVGAETRACNAPSHAPR